MALWGRLIKIQWIQAFASGPVSNFSQEIFVLVKKFNLKEMSAFVLLKLCPKSISRWTWQDSQRNLLGRNKIHHWYYLFRVALFRILKRDLKRSRYIARLRQINIIMFPLSLSQYPLSVHWWCYNEFYWMRNSVKNAYTNILLLKITTIRECYR